MTVTETFFAVQVADMKRATAFYTTALGATVSFGLPTWTSIHIAGVRIGLALSPEHRGERTGLHFAVKQLEVARGTVEKAGGRVVTPDTEVAPGVVIAELSDSEGNTFTLTQR